MQLLKPSMRGRPLNPKRIRHPLSGHRRKLRLVYRRKNIVVNRSLYKLTTSITFSRLLS